MQSPDTDRLHMGDRDWSIVCRYCGQTFEATRSDATFCSTKCRVGWSRRHKKRLNDIETLMQMKPRLLQIAERYKEDLEVIQALESVKSAAASAAYIAEYTGTIKPV